MVRNAPVKTPLAERSRLAVGTAVQGGSQCGVAMHLDPQGVPRLERGARPAGAESGSVASGASAARTRPQRCRRSNPAARHIGNPAREGADVGGWSAQALARVANSAVSPRLLPAPNVTLSRVGSRCCIWRSRTCS